MTFIRNRKSFPVKLFQHPRKIWGQMIESFSKMYFQLRENPEKVQI